MKITGREALHRASCLQLCLTHLHPIMVTSALPRTGKPFLILPGCPSLPRGCPDLFLPRFLHPFQVCISAGESLLSRGPSLNPWTPQMHPPHHTLHFPELLHPSPCVFSFKKIFFGHSVLYSMQDFSSPTRGRTHAPCHGSMNPWTAKEVPFICY